MKKLKRDFALNLRGFKEVNRLSPHFITFSFLTSLFGVVQPFIGFFMVSYIVDALLTQKPIGYYIAVVAISLSLTLICNVTAAYLRQKTNEKQKFFYWYKRKAFNERVMMMDFELLESPKTHQLNQRIKNIERTNGSGLLQVTWFIGEFFSGIVSTALSVAVIVSLFFTSGGAKADGWIGLLNSPISAVIVFAIMICAAIFAARMNKKQSDGLFKAMDEVTEGNVQYNYYLENYLSDYHAGKDVRVYGLAPLILRDLMDIHKVCSSILGKMGNASGRNLGAVDAVSAFSGGVVTLFAVAKAFWGVISIGSVLRYTGAATQFVGGLMSMFSVAARLSSNTRFLEQYFEFLELKGERYQGTLPVEKRNDNQYVIEFKNVSFRYAGAEEYALKNLSFQFRVGEKLAVVGKNGSGKTTMIKLLVRLYDPTEGEITLNGIDIRKYSYEEYLTLFSVVFQDFKLFSFPLAQNVAAALEYEQDVVSSTLDKTGLRDRVETMPRGINTPLYKDFDEDGVEISGGEAQKIALARALYKDAPFIILDEPTAALDPIAEFDVYSDFDKIVGSKSAIYISHRLSSCRFCDNIVVFDKGSLVQHGSHNSLLSANNGLYHALWNAQAQYYEQV